MSLDDKVEIAMLDMVLSQIKEATTTTPPAEGSGKPLNLQN